MKFSLLSGCIFSLLSTIAAGQQVDCGNIGFEQGTTTGWLLTNGKVANDGQNVIFQQETVGTLEAGHRITSLSDGNDPRITAEAIPMVAPGSTHSIRIGNVTRGSRFDRIKTSFVVSAENTLFQYKLAVVLQNANHEAYEKPGFTIRITDRDGQELPCSFYDVQVSAAGTVDGFKTQGDIQYRNWTVGAMDLSNYIGKTITVEVTAHGCTHNGHFGYAYFDAQCLKSEIIQVSACPDAEGYVVLKAPDGFEKYTWNTGQTTASIRAKPVPGQKYWVKLVPYSSLNASCELQLDHQIKFQAVETQVIKSICAGDGFAVGDTVYRTSGQFTRKVNRNAVCDSTVHLSLVVHPIQQSSQQVTICEGGKLTVGDSTYQLPGTYVYAFKSVAGCDSLVTTYLSVNKLDVTLTANTLIVRGDSTLLQPLVTPSGSYSYRWEPPGGLSCTTCAQPWAHPSATTQYRLLVTDSDQVCQRRLATTVTVIPCAIQTPSAFSPNADRLNDYFFIKENRCVKQVREMSVFNRWGEVIYHKKDFVPTDPGAGWDGMYQGQRALTGVYTYTFRIELNNGDLITHNGFVHLIR
ncbi:gliding motility-associated C-terminal domain-containing protein [Larkinella sp.]|uniref:T9SS type B sorting domain-containing protein n=1 Tax=Larkinella sp. TaxID=2034517 RepID=UPI003BAB0C71